MLTIPADFSERELARYYTLTEEDLAVIQRRRPENKLGFAVQLGHLRFPGWPWDPAAPLPATIVAYLAQQLDLDPAHLQAYATRQIHRNRLLQLAREGARSTPQRLENLVAFLIETAATLTDYTLEMHDRIMTMFLSQCKQSYATETENHGPALRATARRYAAVGKALITARDEE